MSTPIRVMNVISRLNIGGISPFLIPLTAILHQMGYESQLVAGTVGAREGDMTYLANADVRLISVPSLGREISPLRDMATIRQLAALMRRERPHIVHTHTAKGGFAGRIAAWLARVPIILHTYHGHVFSGYFGPAKTRVYLTLEQFCGRVSTRILTVADSLRRELVEDYHVGPARKVEVVIPGYPLDHLMSLARPSGDLRTHFNIPAAAPLIGIVGRLVPIKNHALFLRAAQIVHQQRPDARFLIVGDGELRAEVEAQITALGLAECTHITGWITDLTEIYGALDALAITSKNEGLPSSVIEALVTGLPIAGTAVGGVRDMLANGLGLLVPPDDTQALATALLRLISDSQVQSKAMLNRSAAFQLYDIHPAAQRLHAYYQQLLSRYPVK